MEKYIRLKVNECMEEWKSSSTKSLREILGKYFQDILSDAAKEYNKEYFLEEPEACMKQNKAKMRF